MRIEIVPLNKKNLLTIKEIDDTFYQKGLFSIGWYLERYTDKHSGILLFDQDTCVGYLVCVPIRKQFYDALLNGVLIHDISINPRMFVESSQYHYISSCVILEKYRRMGYAKMMVEKLLEGVDGNYCALTITDDGYNFAKYFMDLELTINDKVSVFKLEK